MADPALPRDLLALGFKLIIRAPDRLFAVSRGYGCTGTKDSLSAIIREARSLAADLGRRSR